MKSQHIIIILFIISCFFFACSKDDTAPVITILGKNPDTLIVKTLTTYADAGATATDDKDGDITSKIVKSSLFKPDVVGKWSFYYDVEDRAHNVAEEKQRIVEVVKADGNYKIDATCNTGPNVVDTIQVISNSTYDTLTLNGFYNVSIKAALNNGKYTIYSQAITTGMDSIDGDITVSGTHLTLNFTYHPDFGAPVTCDAPMIKL